MSLPTEKSHQSEPAKPLLERDLVVLARRGDPHAFEQLFTRYYQQISLYLIRMTGNDATGYELTQETFLKAWQSLPGLQDEARFLSWLYQIATNLARDYQRRSRLISWLPWENYQERPGMHQVGPERAVEEEELLKAALAQVPLKYRSCLILYIVEDLPQRQIAERLGIKASYVSNYIRRGLVELRNTYTHLAGEPGS